MLKSNQLEMPIDISSNHLQVISYVVVISIAVFVTVLSLVDIEESCCKKSSVSCDCASW